MECTGGAAWSAARLIRARRRTNRRLSVCELLQKNSSSRRVLRLLKKSCPKPGRVRIVSISRYRYLPTRTRVSVKIRPLQSVGSLNVGCRGCQFFLKDKSAFEMNRRKSGWFSRVCSVYGSTRLCANLCSVFFVTASASCGERMNFNGSFHEAFDVRRFCRRQATEPVFLKAPRQRELRGALLQTRRYSDRVFASCAAYGGAKDGAEALECELVEQFVWIF